MERSQYSIVQKNVYIMCHIKPYKYDTNVEDITCEKYVLQCKDMITRYVLIYYIKAWK